MSTLAATVEGSSPILNISIFGLFVVITLVIVFRASRNTKTASDYYAAGRAFTGPQNGIAISGDYLSAASFLGIAGAIAVYGYDGFLYSIGFLVAWLVALLLVAELLRNTGKFTMGDVLAFRMKQRPVRAAAATSTLAVSFFYLLAQMAGAGGLVALLLGIEGKTGQSLVIAVVSTSPACCRPPSTRAARRARRCSARASSTARPGRPNWTSSPSASRWCSARPVCRTS